ncbi:hypothetical protein SAMN05216303_102748 [Rhodoferax sp. OV413]|nr:hypothetical protein SAMN05216303_102748 [Rhodoferax sp. OV413]
MYRPYLARLAALVAGCAAVAQSALAVNVAEAVPAMELADQQIQVDSRIVRLPVGQWNYIALSQGAVTSGGRKIGSTYTAYAMDVQGGKMRSGIVLTLPSGSFSASNWLNEPCKDETALFKNDFGGSFSQPECLLVYRRRSHLQGAVTGVYAQAQQWMNATSVKLPGPVYEVVYSKYAGSDYGQIRVFVPTNTVANDQAIIGWAEQLPLQLRRIFENRDSLAALSELPVAAEKVKVQPPVAVADGRLQDIDAIPYINDKGRERYRVWLKHTLPRAFAISPTGSYAYTSGASPADETLPSAPVERALLLCNRSSKTPCKLYAVDKAVVWAQDSGLVAGTPQKP